MSAFRNLIMTGLPVYTVTFDYGDIPAQRVKKNRLAVRPAIPYREGHDFTGWFINGVLFDFDTPVIGDMALTAGWSLKTFTVSFDANGGNAVAPQVVAWGNKATYVPCTRDNYELTGWTLNGTPFDFNTPVTSDMTLTAQWARALYTQSGTASVKVLGKGSGNKPNTYYGVVVAFSVPFTQVVSGNLNGRAIPYDNKSDTYSYLNVSGFSQQTGYTYWYLDERYENYMQATSGTTYGNMTWTVTGYYA